jgi:hypothetical protein
MKTHPIKFQLTEMMTRPEPSVSPVVTLYLTLLSAACLATAGAIFCERLF